MDSPPYLAQLERELAAVEACLRRDLTASIEHCGDWTLYHLADHLGRGNLWAAAAITENRGDYQTPATPRDQGNLVTWFHEASAVLLSALDTDPATPAWTIFPPATVGFWQRRRALEALVHRWDAEQALGISGPLDPVLAGDGVAEVIDTIAPRHIALGRAAAPEQAVRLTAVATATNAATIRATFTDTDSDSGGSWVWGPGDPIATITATAPDLLLMLWGRISSGHRAFTWEGDRNAAQVLLDGSLVP